MSSYLRPRRGKRSTANSTLTGTAVLKNGEIFFECPNSGTGTGQGRLVMGNGTSNYENLKPFLAFDKNAVQDFDNTTAPDDRSVSTILNNINPSSTLANNITNIKQALLNINNAINSMPKKYIFIGDSYCEGSGTGNGWRSKLCTLLGLTSSDYYTNSQGGIGFKDDGFLGLIQSLSSSITDKTSITDIIALGGANDMAITDDSLATYIQTFISYCRTNYPNAIIHIGDCAGSDNKTYVGVQYARVLRGFQKGVRGEKVHLLKNLQYCLHDRSLLGSDAIHPTNTGYEVLAKAIQQSLTDDYNAYYMDIDKRCVYDTTTYSIGASTINCIVDNNITTLSSIIGIDLVAKTNQVFAINTDMIIGEVSTKLICVPTSNPDYYDYSYTPVLAYGYFNKNGAEYRENIRGFINISGRYILWHPKDPQLNQHDYYTYCKTFTISPFHITMPSIYC